MEAYGSEAPLSVRGSRLCHSCDQVRACLHFVLSQCVGRRAGGPRGRFREEPAGSSAQGTGFLYPLHAPGSASYSPTENPHDRFADEPKPFDPRQSSAHHKGENLLGRLPQRASPRGISRLPLGPDRRRGTQSNALSRRSSAARGCVCRCGGAFWLLLALGCDVGWPSGQRSCVRANAADGSDPANECGRCIKCCCLSAGSLERVGSGEVVGLWRACWSIQHSAQTGRLSVPGYLGEARPICHADRSGCG